MPGNVRVLRGNCVSNVRKWKNKICIYETLPDFHSQF